jgi:hypothetical protein
MLLGFLIFVLVSETYTVSINPFSISFIDIGIVTGAGAPAPAPGLNFELKTKSNLSLNFEINLLLIIPVEAEIGIREYLEKELEFQGAYLYQGIAAGWRLFPTKFSPSIVLTTGYKSIKKSGFTMDYFLGVKVFYTKGEEWGLISINSFFAIMPAIGLYLGHSW